jgi:hypothetical protein
MKEKSGYFSSNYMRSIIATFVLKNDLILEKDYNNIVKTVREKNPHPLTNEYLY